MGFARLYSMYLVYGQLHGTQGHPWTGITVISSNAFHIKETADHTHVGANGGWLLRLFGLDRMERRRRREVKPNSSYLERDRNISRARRLHGTQGHPWTGITVISSNAFHIKETADLLRYRL
jgi:hypothetical protein